MAEDAYIPERHGPDHPNDGWSILGYGPAGLPHLPQETESPRVGVPAHGIPELQGAPEVRVAHRPDKAPGPV